MKKDIPIIISIFLFMLNLVIGLAVFRYSDQRILYGIVYGWISVFTYWMLDYYVPDIVFKFRYCLYSLTRDGRIYMLIELESDQMVKQGKEEYELNSAIDIEKSADNGFAELYSEFSEVIFDEMKDKYVNVNMLNIFSRNYYMHRRAIEWLYGYGYRANNIEELKEDLPGLIMRLSVNRLNRCLNNM